MSKLTKHEKVVRGILLEQLAKAGGMVRFNPVSGVTVLACPSIKGNKARFGRVAIAICSDKDKAKRKRGEYEALNNWENGNSFPVHIENWNYVGDWKENVIEIFSEAGYM